MENMQDVISNWNNLNEEQKNIAKNQLNFLPKDYEKPKSSAAEFLDTFGWVKIENFISPELSKILYTHTLYSVKRLEHIENNLNIKNYDKGLWGSFDDKQVPGAYSRYGDPIFDTLLFDSLNKIEYLTHKKLIPTYSYYRVYVKNNDLKKHIDRPECAISLTMNLGFNISNVDPNVYPDYNWPIFVSGFKKDEILPIRLNPGDMLIYKGNFLEHWRDEFKGTNHSQVFLHYVEKNEENENKMFDGRYTLGLPKDLIFSKEKTNNLIVDDKSYKKVY